MKKATTATLVWTCLVLLTLISLCPAESADETTKKSPAGKAAKSPSSSSKKKTSSKSKRAKMETADSVDIQTLKCLVCEATIAEIEHFIYKVDPKKVSDTGSYSVNSKGDSAKKIVPYAQSQEFLMEITEKVCPVLDEEWMQGRMMDTGKFTLERAQTIHGNMNPVLGRGFEPLPQEDDKRLSRICYSILEEMEDDVHQVFASPEMKKDALNELCHRRHKFCIEPRPRRKLDDEL